MEALKIDLDQAFKDQVSFAQAVDSLDSAWKADPTGLDYDQIAALLVNGATFKDILREPDQKLAEQLSDLSQKTLSLMRIKASMIPTTDCFYNPFDDRDLERQREDARLDRAMLEVGFNLLIRSITPVVK